MLSTNHWPVKEGPALNEAQVESMGPLSIMTKKDIEIFKSIKSILKGSFLEFY